MNNKTKSRKTTTRKTKSRKTTTRKSMVVPIKVERFASLNNKPSQPKKGVSYAVEKAENIDTNSGKKVEGDIFKKYKNGILNKQIFVPKSGVKKLIQQSIIKVKTGGNNKTENPRIVYVQVPAAQGVAQAAPVPAPAAPVPVVVQDGTSFGQALKTGVASGIGWGLAGVAIEAFFGDN